MTLKILLSILTFECAHEFIDNAFDGSKENKVLVHCRVGRSRSSTIVISYLMKQGMMLEKAVKLVKSKRSIIEPNCGFMDQLEKYQEELEKERLEMPEDVLD